jgi:carboxypeptidase C (cathepsin A)
MMFENGPVTIPRYPAGYYGIDPNVSLSDNPYSWTHTTAIMYIEQPQGGTGFSQSGTVPTNETDISRDMYHFLQNFYTIFDTNHPNNTKHPSWREKKLFLFGESYAGMFVPSIAHYIYQQNVEIEHGGKSKTRHIPLAGIALGNGWMDVQVQGPVVIDYAWWHGMIDTSTRKALLHEWENCRPDGNNNNNNSPVTIRKHSPFHTFTVPDECGIMGAVLQAAGLNVVDWGSPNAYDVTTWDP